MLLQTKKLSTRRRGIILLVVVTMLALFAVVGITFVLYAESAANSARQARETQFGGHTGVAPGLNITNRGSSDDAPPIPNEIFNKTLGDLIYDVEDDVGRYNALRGWSLARDMYGYNYNAINGQPFAGLGYPEGVTFGSITDANASQQGATASDRAYNYINYSDSPYPADYLGTNPNGYFPQRDPEWITNGQNGNQAQYSLRSAANAIYVPKNAPYTAVDTNHLYLGAISTASGTPQVVMPSFFRPWHFETQANGITYTGFAPTNNTLPVLHPSNPLWGTSGDPIAGPRGQYRILRPTNYYHKNFPPVPMNADGSYTGDVQNLEGGPGNDSLWMDIDLPVRRWRGKNYKPLVAMFITDLDGRINSNIAGSMIQASAKNGNPDFLQRSNQGWGPWEQNLAIAMGDIDPNTALGDPNSALVRADAFNVITRPPTAYTAGRMVQSMAQTPQFNSVGNDPGGSPIYQGQLSNVAIGKPYGFDLSTFAGNYSSDFPKAIFYSNADYDALDLQKSGNSLIPVPSAQKIALPANVVGLPKMTAPTFPATQFQAWNITDNAVQPTFVNPTELIYHPSLHNPYLTLRVPPQNFQTDQNWSLNHGHNFSDVRWLNYKLKGENDAILRSDLANLAPNSLYNLPTAAASRFRITPTSNDLITPGITGYEWASGRTDHMFTTYGNNVDPLARGLITQFKIANQNITTPDGALSPFAFPTLYNPVSGDYSALNKASAVQAKLWGAGNSNIISALDLNRKLTPFPSGTNGIAQTLIPQIMQERQVFARDIFLRLVVATGIWTNPPSPTTANYGTGKVLLRDQSIPNYNTAQVQNSLRYLAQLAVNIVDYIDQDDVMTVYNWRNLNPFDPNYLTFAYDANPGAPPSLATDAVSGTEIIFGVENPRLVINEVYSHIRNDPSDPFLANPQAPNDTTQWKATLPQPYIYQHWIELKCPVTAPVSQNGQPNLQSIFKADFTYYRILKIQATSDLALDGYVSLLENYDHRVFDATFFNLQTGALNNGFASTVKIIPFKQIFKALSQANPVVANAEPLDQTSDQQNYIVIGPPDAQTDTTTGKYATAAGVQANTLIPNMSNDPTMGAGKANVQVKSSVLGGTTPYPPNMDQTATTADTQALTTNGANNRYIFVLQRMAMAPQYNFDPTNPTKDPAPNGVNPILNSWVTVDYFVQAGNSIFDNRVVGAGKGNFTRIPNTAIAQQFSIGRRQPLDGYQPSSQLLNLVADADAPAKDATNSRTPTISAATTVAAPTAIASVVQQTPQPAAKPAGVSPTITQPPAITNILSTFGQVNYPPPQRYLSPSLTLKNGNQNLSANYDWYTHLDRPLISPAELLTVCAYSNHRVTNQFHWSNNTYQPSRVNSKSTAAGTAAAMRSQRMMHLAPWTDMEPAFNDPTGTVQPDPNDTNFFVADQVRLFRALALLETKTRVRGIPYGGRTPGKVNINTIYDPTILKAVVSGSDANTFTYIDANGVNSDVTNAWTAIQKYRWPGESSTNIQPGNFSRNDRAFMPPGLPIYTAHTNATNFYYRNNSGIQNTFLWGNPLQVNTNAPNPVGNQPLFITDQFHPYMNHEMLIKAMNNLTTRSNTFAVWCTVGYFEVENDGPYTPSNRPRLGKELGSKDGTVVRHKFFSVVDRSNLATYSAVAGSQPQASAPVLFDFQPDPSPNQDPYTPTSVNGTSYFQYTCSIPGFVYPSTISGNTDLMPLVDAFSGNHYVIKSLSGEYDGRPWKIQSQTSTTQGTSILIGAGTPNEEFITIGYNGATNVVQGFMSGLGATNNASSTPQPAPYRLTIRTKNKHYPGESIAVFPVIGAVEPSFYANPGPQTKYFNYQASPYTDVIRYATQIR
ncbi:hypothetical protein KIH39_18190 [Telmatocola sphagniphila]|uniref:Verru_Chthon cassette protein A n=1 Tax=Telmatocola sphagniphila TaxID=1123043 RepID=A0A8E6B5H2_9BACT|nr:hypothetical protein [Telmatocola sphagniphila]QVL30770.1 hypothetical protein KIH39_18190 [Telmatocola sphagniphila]